MASQNEARKRRKASSPDTGTDADA